MTVPRSRILDLVKVQCRIFGATFNPDRLRLGTKILRQRLKGPTVASYYPRRLITLKDIRNLIPGMDTWDEKEEDRLEGLQQLRSRGKGPPKKKRTALEYKKAGRRK